MATHKRIREPVQPAEQDLKATGKVGEAGILFDEMDSSLGIGDCQRVGYRLFEQLVLLVPATGTIVKFRDPGRLCLSQTGAQHLCKKVMVAIPPSFIVKRDKEKITALHLLQERLAVVSFSHGITEQPTEPVQQAGLYQEVLHIFWLSQEDFFNQVVRHVTMRTREGGDEVGHVVAVL